MKKRGFTLVELMVTVAIVGVLAVLATYGVRKYIANAKTAEARASVGQIAKDAALAFERETYTSTNVLTRTTSTNSLKMLCPSTTTVPSAPGSIKAAKYQSSRDDWKNAGFACLKFEIVEPQYFMYQYTSTSTAGAIGDSFSATAQGDLNGDTTLSLFQMTGKVQGSRVLNISPGMLEVRPEE